MVLTKADTKIDLMAHLMRRAGFGASREELESRSQIGYEETVEELLTPSSQDPVDRYQFLRYYPMWWKPGTMGGLGQAEWVWTMISTMAPLQEKMCLFYHNIFATGVAKVDHYDEIQDMIDMFRKKGLGNYKEILMEVAKSPAMIYWLDNNENHANSVNENWGRELLELFTMGVGNYTETDVRECSRAFTGWTLEHKLPRFHMGRWTGNLNSSLKTTITLRRNSWATLESSMERKSSTSFSLNQQPLSSSHATYTASLSQTNLKSRLGLSPLQMTRMQ